MHDVIVSFSDDSELAGHPVMFEGLVGYIIQVNGLIEFKVTSVSDEGIVGRTNEYGDMGDRIRKFRWCDIYRINYV